MHEPIQLQSTTIQGAQDGPELLVLGGVHGDEFESMAAIRRLASTLGDESLQGRVTLVPVVNEAAYRRGQRTAEDGLDLARTCPGRPGGSITERVAHAVSALIRRADYLVDLHSGGNFMHFHPTAGYTLHPEADILDVQRRMARAFNMPVVWGTTSRLDGRTLSVARDARVPAIYAEWMGGGACDPAGVEGYAEGCLNVMGELGMLDRPSPVSRIEHEVEDDRDRSGQIEGNPAPFSGFFEARAKLMDPVKHGDVLGVVTDPLGERQEEIVSARAGVVLCLRVFSRVQEGESLAEVLEIDRGC